MEMRKLPWLLGLLTNLVAAQSDVSCGPGPNVTTTLTAASAVQSALVEPSSGFPCTTYTGSLVIIPSPNYSLTDYGSDADISPQTLDGNLTINCTGVSTDVVLSNQPNGGGAYSAFVELKTVTGSISILGCNTINTLDLYTLSTLGGNLTIAGNPMLSLLLIYGLTDINGSVIVHLESADLAQDLDMTSLRRVGGDLVLTGYVTFTSAEEMAPNLTSVQGSVFINSTGELDCSEWRKLKASGVIKGKIFCSAVSQEKLSSGDIAGIAIGGAAAIGIAFIGCFLGRKVNKHSEAKPKLGPNNNSGGNGMPELDGTGKPSMREMEGLQCDESGRLHRNSAQGRQGRSELEDQQRQAERTYSPAELSAWDGYEMAASTEI